MASPELPASPPQLARFPAEARDAYERFRTTGDADALKIVVLAAVKDFMPKPKPGTLAPELADDKGLMEDLGYDSLAIAETVFFFEDLFKVSITNQELMGVRTVGELREFVTRKMAERKPPA